MMTGRLPSNFTQQINEANCKLTFLVNPHAPSGKLVDTDTLTTIASELNSVLLIDEAYVDFVDADYDSMPLVRDNDNVIILRTLSKGYSLAGLRFGYGIGPEELIKPMMDKTRDSYNLDLIGQQIAETAISNRDYAMKNCHRVAGERNKLSESFLELGLTSEESQTNFLLVTVPVEFTFTAKQLYEELKAKGILVRYFADEKVADKLRISIGLPQENKKLVDTIKSL